ncbi:hypothetical protein ACMXYV_10220 [Neptuniibacter sp. SY11_33]|uniref:hypothetical protein n=1 Tax=Neptuniibacter sp. SY11_33 TaxID=3398215 RepID=UPI0039F633FC
MVRFLGRCPYCYDTFEVETDQATIGPFEVKAACPSCHKESLIMDQSGYFLARRDEERNPFENTTIMDYETERPQQTNDPTSDDEFEDITSSPIIGLLALCGVFIIGLIIYASIPFVLGKEFSVDSLIDHLTIINASWEKIAIAALISFIVGSIIVGITTVTIKNFIPSKFEYVSIGLATLLILPVAPSIYTRAITPSDCSNLSGQYKYDIPYFLNPNPDFDITLNLESGKGIVKAINVSTGTESKRITFSWSYSQGKININNLSSPKISDLRFDEPAYYCYPSINGGFILSPFSEKDYEKMDSDDVSWLVDELSFNRIP